MNRLRSVLIGFWLRLHRVKATWLIVFLLLGSKVLFDVEYRPVGMPWPLALSLLVSMLTFALGVVVKTAMVDRPAAGRAGEDRTVFGEPGNTPGGLPGRRALVRLRWTVVVTLASIVLLTGYLFAWQHVTIELYGQRRVIGFGRLAEWSLQADVRPKVADHPRLTPKELIANYARGAEPDDDLSTIWTVASLRLSAIVLGVLYMVSSVLFGIAGVLFVMLPPDGQAVLELAGEAIGSAT